MSDAAEEHIRVSEDVKAELARRKREGESFNDVIERLLEDDRDLLAGAGFWSEEKADRAREIRRKTKEKSKERIRQFAEESDEDS